MNKKGLQLQQLIVLPLYYQTIFVTLSALESFKYVRQYFYQPSCTIGLVKIKSCDFTVCLAKKSILQASYSQMFPNDTKRFQHDNPTLLSILKNVQSLKHFFVYSRIDENLCRNFRTIYGGQEPSRNRVVIPASQATQADGIDSLESISRSLEFLAWRAGTTTLFLLGSWPPIDCSKIPVLIMMYPTVHILEDKMQPIPTISERSAFYAVLAFPVDIIQHEQSLYSFVENTQ